MAGNNIYTYGLWPFNGADGAQSGDGFADTSVAGSTHNLTAVGNAQIDTAQSKFGGSCLYLPQSGSDDYATAGDSSDFDLGADDFGLDCRIRPTSTSNVVILSKQDYGSNNRSWLLKIQDSNTIRFQVSTDGSSGLNADWSYSISTGTWQHIAIMRQGADVDLWVDGVHQGTKTLTASALYDSAIDVVIGAQFNSGSPENLFSGHVEEVRIYAGARPMDVSNDPLYIASGDPADGFTVPPSAYSPPPAELHISRAIRAHTESRLDISRDVTRERGQAELHLSREVDRDTALAQLHLSRTARAHTAARLAVSRTARAHADASLAIPRAHRGHVLGALALPRRARAHVLSRLDLSRRLRAHVLTRLDLARHAFARAGWALYATDTATDTTTYLGFVKDDDSPLALSGVSLADGTWDIEARPWGNFWRDTRSATRLRVVISGGEILSGTNDLPEVTQLRAGDISQWGRTISWTWQDGYRVTTPTDFALWFAAASPVDTSGEPDITITARPADRNHTYRYNQTAAAVVAIAARDSSENKGTVSELALDWISGTLTDPDPQWAVKGN